MSSVETIIEKAKSFEFREQTEHEVIQYLYHKAQRDAKANEQQGAEVSF